MKKIAIIELFLSYLNSSDKSPATISSYRSDLYLFAKWFENENHEILSAIKITPTDLRKYKQNLIAYPMKPKSINSKIGVIRIFVHWLWDTGKLKQKFPLPTLVKEAGYAPQWLDKNQQHRMLRYIEKQDDKRDCAVIKLLLNTGLRVNELSQLKWSDINMSERKGDITVRYSKSQKYRTIPLNKDARLSLFDLGFKDYAGQEKSVLQGQRGGLGVRGIQKLLKRRLQYTPFEHLSPHMLRHTFCKNLVNANVSLEKVAALAGHSNLDTTKLYCQPSLTDLSQAVERIGEEE